MNELNVKLNRFSFGQLGISADKVLPQHQETLQKCLVKIFHDNVRSVPVNGQKVQLHLRSDGKPLLVIGGREVEVKPSPEVKKVGRIFRYYQNVGLLPRQSEEGQQEREISSRSVRAVSDAAVPGTTANLWAGTRFGDDSLSLYRRIIAVRYGSDSPFYKELGYYAGSIWSLIFCKELFDGVSEHERAKEIGDTEGTRRAEAKLFSGGILLAGSLSYLAGKVLEEQLSMSLGAPILAGSSLLFGAGALIGVATSALGVYRCEDFNNRLTEYLQNPHLTEVERMRGAWTFLKDALVVSAEEKAEIEEAVRKNYPSLNEEDKQTLIQKKIEHLTETKVKYMKRRTSTKSLQLILENADDILAKLNSKSSRVQKEGLVKATQLVDVIQKENRKKMVLYAIGTIASIISFVGLLFMTLTPAAIFPFVLCGIASSVYLALSIYYWAPSVPKLYHWIKGDTDPSLSILAKQRFAS